MYRPCSPRKILSSDLTSRCFLCCRHCEPVMWVECRAPGVPCRCSQLFFGCFADRGTLGRCILESLDSGRRASSRLARKAHFWGGHGDLGGDDGGPRSLSNWWMRLSIRSKIIRVLSGRYQVTLCIWRLRCWHEFLLHSTPTTRWGLRRFSASLARHGDLAPAVLWSLVFRMLLPRERQEAVNLVPSLLAYQFDTFARSTSTGVTGRKSEEPRKLSRIRRATIASTLPTTMPTLGRRIPQTRHHHVFRPSGADVTEDPFQELKFSPVHVPSSCTSGVASEKLLPSRCRWPACQYGRTRASSWMQGNACTSDEVVALCFWRRSVHLSGPVSVWRPRRARTTSSGTCLAWRRRAGAALFQEWCHQNSFSKGPRKTLSDPQSHCNENLGAKSLTESLDNHSGLKVNLEGNFQPQRCQSPFGCNESAPVDLISNCETTAGIVLSVLPQAIVLETCTGIAFRVGARCLLYRRWWRPRQRFPGRPKPSTQHIGRSKIHLSHRFSQVPKAFICTREAGDVLRWTSGKVTSRCPTLHWKFWMLLGGKEEEIDDVCCARNRWASTKLWGNTFMDTVSERVRRTKHEEVFSESRKARARDQNKEQRGGALPQLESLSLCRVGWALKSHLCLSPCSKGLAMQQKVKRCSTFSRGEVVETCFPFRCPPKPTKAEMELRAGTSQPRANPWSRSGYLDPMPPGCRHPVKQSVARKAMRFAQRGVCRKSRDWTPYCSELKSPTDDNTGWHSCPKRRPW